MKICSVCKNEFDTVDDLETHKCIWFCECCCLSFHKKQIFERHTKSVAIDSNDLQCNFCSKVVAESAPDIETRLFLDGCGGWHPYVFGLCAALQDHMKPEVSDGRIGFQTISGSGFAVGCLPNTRNAAYTYALWRARHCYHVRNFGHRHWYTMVHKHSMDILSTTDYSMQSPHIIQSVGLCGASCVDKSECADISTMADALVASAFILGLDTASGIWWRVNGKRLIDGSYSMWQPPGAINVFELTKFKAITAQGRNLAFWKIAGLFDTDTDWMYTAGYDDAVDQVIPLLRKKLNSEDPKNDSPQRTPPHRDTLPDKLNILNKTSCLPSSVTKVTCIIYFLLVQIPVFLVWYILAFVVYFPLSYLHRYCCGSQTAHKQLNN